MILVDKNFIHITTKNNSYLIYINKYGDVQNLHYGSKFVGNNFNALLKERAFIVNTLFEKDDMTYCVDGINFEFSMPFRGDSRSASLSLKDNDCSMADFVFDKIVTGVPQSDNMPIPKGGESVCLQFIDRIRQQLILQLWYIVYEEYDVICKFVKVINNSDKIINISKVMSAQYDIPKNVDNLVIFDGAWGRERQRKDIPIVSGKLTAGSYSGMSSAECNPFFMVKESNSTEKVGSVYAFNLMYSGSHEISVESTPYNSLRIMHGVQSEAFNYLLPTGTTFTSPVAISTFSSCGVGKASENIQRFTSEVIVQKKDIPIMLNSWESMYFDINESKLTKLADKAKELGFDGIVIDDGWFLDRNDDTTSLGDWTEDKKKFLHGLKAYSKYLESKNMILGIWIEPEMISEKSLLFNEHPTWALKNIEVRSIVGRNQLILDLTQREVEDFVYLSLERLVTEYGAKYIKWDFNRRFADIVGCEGSGYFYRYYTALYNILKKFTARYPNVILENCASGGGRFDLGMMSFMPISWVSDNTDPLSRAEIQTGSSYGYPARVMLNHISASPSHLTKRESSFDTRKNTALIGSFGVQYDITKISVSECNNIKNAIAEYNSIKKLITSGIIYRLLEDSNYIIWQIMNGDGGLLYIMQKRYYSVSSLPVIKLVNLNSKGEYLISGNCFEIKELGINLMNFGINLPMNYQGCGEEKLNITDNSTMLLKIKKIN